MSRSQSTATLNSICLISIIGFLGIAMTVTGCGTPPPPCIVKGAVHINRMPANGVYVLLTDSTGNTAGSGRTDQDGAYRLTVPQAGNYAVTCFRPKVTESAGDYIEGDDLFKGRYRDPQKPAATASISVGENMLPVINLQ
jgi:hypothetical protein